MKKTQRLLALLLALLMTLSLAACGGQANTPAEDDNAADTPAETRVFTDSTGREVTVPAQIDKVAVSGPLAQIVLFALCPDKLVGVADEWDESAQQYLDEKYYNLPLLGQLYGGKATLNLEELLATGAEVIIDLGEHHDDVTMLYFCQVSYSNFSVAVSEDGESWSDDYIADMAEGECFQWKYLTPSYMGQDKYGNDKRFFYSQPIKSLSLIHISEPTRP